MLFLRFCLWIAPNVLLGVCAFGLFRRAAYKTQPFFLTLVVFHIGSFLVLFATDLLAHYGISSLNTYRWIMVASTSIQATLQLAVLYEIADTVLFSRASLVQRGKPLLRAIFATFVMVGVGASPMLHQTGLEEVMGTFQILDFASSLLSVGLLLSLLLFSRALHISWRGLPVGIALGFGVDATTELSAAALFSVLGRAGYIHLDIVRQAAFHICVLIWLVYIFLPSKPSSFTGHRPDRTDLEFWDQELQKIMR